MNARQIDQREASRSGRLPRPLMRLHRLLKVMDGFVPPALNQE